MVIRKQFNQNAYYTVIVERPKEIIYRDWEFVPFTPGQSQPLSEEMIYIIKGLHVYIDEMYDE